MNFTGKNGLKLAHALGRLDSDAPPDPKLLARLQKDLEELGDDEFTEELHLNSEGWIE